MAGRLPRGAAAAAALLAAAAAEPKRLRIVNGCDEEPLWVAHEAAADAGPDEQNVRIGPGDHFDFLTPDGLSATRYWAKMGCDEHGDHCTLGGSGGPGQKCVKHPPEVPKDDYSNCAPPIDTKFEASFGINGKPCNPELQTPDAMEGCDYVDASLVDGFTLPFQLVINRNGGTGCDKDWVETIDCRRLSFALCPSDEELTAAGMTVDLKATNPHTNVVSGCYAPCQKLVDSKWNNDLAVGRDNSDPEVSPYCCPTPPETPESCREGPIEKTQFLRAVHEACPGVYGYAYDDGMGLLRCDSKSTYEMTFYCPQHELSKLPPIKTTKTSTTTIPGLVVVADDKVTTSNAVEPAANSSAKPKAYGGVHVGKEEPAEPTRPSAVGSSAEEHDCQDALSAWQEEWPAEKKEWCCSSEELGCETIEQPFDCKSSFDDREEKWTFNKKDWCCAYQSVGCEDEALVASRKWQRPARPLLPAGGGEAPAVAAALCSAGLLLALTAAARHAGACFGRTQARAGSLRPPPSPGAVAGERRGLHAGGAEEPSPPPRGGPGGDGVPSPTESSRLLPR